MSKKTLNLSIEEPIKRRAKRIAKQRGLSVSQFFEKLVTEQKDDEVFTPTPGTAAYNIANAIPESEKLGEYDYKKLKAEMLEERYGNK
jgi:antitoxin component of RelBE/YafQ-DinJ toxin-antitoxin module